MQGRTVYAAGRAAKWLVMAVSVFLVAVILPPAPPLAIAGLVFGGIVSAYVIQVLGFLLAILAVRGQLRVSRIETTTGFPRGFWINHGPVSTGRHAIVLLGGLLANLAAAGVVLVFPLPRAIAASLAVLFAAQATEELIPVRRMRGRLSVGAQLLGLRSYGREAAVLKDLEDFWANRDSPEHSPGVTDRVLTAYWEGEPTARRNAHLLAVMLRREGRVAELLRLHAGLTEPDEVADEARRGALVELEWNVLAVPGLPAGEVERAADRLERMPEFRRPDRRTWLAAAMALARLRQRRFAEVERLCGEAMAGELEPVQRARVLATVALARRALGQPHRDLIAEAQTLAPDDDLVAEAAASRGPVHVGGNGHGCERAAQLVSILVDVSAREDERDDAAMDLEFFSGTLVESALIDTIREEGFSSVLAQACAESLAGIWAREGRIDQDFFAALAGPARDEVIGILSARAPGLLPS